ncbi:hypothetical protein BBJ28_00016033 [Nothophytophthora sp. Chile5]|nr:hypothetical protein BBJ28_00016033 [Nothophytophthora sp. Chile5]
MLSSAVPVRADEPPAASAPASASVSTSTAVHADADADADPLADQWTTLKAMKWTQGKDLTAFVQDLALRSGKRALVATSGGSYKKFVCSSEAPCPWLLNAVCSRPRKRPASAATSAARFWYVTSGLLTHSVNCDSVARPTARQLKASSVLRAAVHADARVSSASLVAQLQTAEALHCSKSMVYKAKSDLLDALEAARVAGRASPAVRTALQQLPAYLTQLQALNPHVAAVYETETEGAEMNYPRPEPPSAASPTDGTSCLLRTLLALDPTTVWNDQSVFGLDAMEMQHVGYNGTLLALVGRDGALQPRLHAAALVPEASAAHCTWFLTKLLAHGFPLRRFPLVSSGRGALLAACTALQVPNVSLCTRYVLEAMRETATLALQPTDEALVWQAQRAEAESEHLSVLAQLARQNPAATEYLRALDPSLWCLYPVLARRKMYGWQTTRFEELDLGETSLGLAPLASQLPYEAVKQLSLLAMHAAFQRHERASQWESERRVVTPAAEQLMQQQLALVPLYSVCMSSTHLAFVWNAHKPQIRQRRVDLQQRTCTCACRLQYGIPCRHILAALQKLDALGRAVDFFDECYLVRNYVASFKNRALDLPVEESLARDLTLRPPRLVTKQQRATEGHAKKTKKRKARNRPSNERKRGLYKCHKCQRAEGHNKGTCPYQQE